MAQPSSSKINVLPQVGSATGSAPLQPIDVSNFSSEHVRSALKFLCRAKALDPINPTATGFLALLKNSVGGPSRPVVEEEDELNDLYQSHMTITDLDKRRAKDEAERERTARAKKPRIER